MTALHTTCISSEQRARGDTHALSKTNINFVSRDINHCLGRESYLLEVCIFNQNTVVDCSHFNSSSSVCVFHYQKA